MSAIAGIYSIDGKPVAPNDLERMAESLAHRGSDRQGLWHKGPVGLVHRMLWTTPESLHERLPLIDGTGDLVLTADARIDNRDELVKALGLASSLSDEFSDSELILGAYQKWGERCPEQLLGDFAFAIWDAKRQHLFCARDPMGVRPFYYHHSALLFVFASEIKALHCLSQVPRLLNEMRVADYLVRLFEDRAITFYRDILRLPAAHSLIVARGGEIRLRRYWALDPSREVRLRSDDEYAEAFLGLFTEAVRCRTRSAFPVGSTLSGGVDSSSVACTARRVLTAAGKQTLHTFSAIFPGLPEKVLPLIDERRYMSAVLAMGGFESHYVHADRLSPLTDLDKVLWHMDEAFLAPNLYMHWALYRAAQE
ncbi:MAG: lasso peptide isopeptide bond-forming cyclase, partial [Anaerolineae bacterium]|nr:lasso peptide isopeptide bond-forming cyclase [Anaerolineae bacterium]